MPIILPFRGLRYNSENVPLEDVIAPPYDVISVEQQDRLYARHAKNVVRLILGREQDRYAAAADALQVWMKDGTLMRDKKPSIYMLHQTYDAGSGREVTRKGFIALCRVEDLDKGIVLPHEKTHAKPREDRFRLFSATNANFSQIFSLYWDPENRIDSSLNGSTQHTPVIDVIFEEVRNRLWRVDDEAIIGGVAGLMKDGQVLIADGHHRYETAIAYRDAKRKANPDHTGDELYNYVMMFFSNIEDDGLAILPTHRVIHSLRELSGDTFRERLAEHFVIREVASVKALQTGMETASSRSFGFAVSGDERLYLASLRPNLTAAQAVRDDLPIEVKELDVTVLHSLVIRDLLGIGVEAQEQKTNIDYVKGLEDAIAMVRTGKAQIAFLMHATKLSEVRSVARAGHVMPQKSTFFFPKLVTGLVMNLMQDGRT